MSDLYRSILLATDLSDNSALALRHALELANLCDAKVHVLHVMPEMDAVVTNYVASIIGEDKMATLELEHEKEVEGDIRSEVEAFIASNGNGSVTDVSSIEVHHGNPVETILKIADKLDVDLLVLGGQGKGKLHYAVIGSVAEKVVRKSQRPVVIVPLR